MDKTYRNSDGVTTDFNGEITVENQRVWIWSNDLQMNISHGCKNERDALLDAITHLIFTVEMYRDDRDDLRRKLRVLDAAFESIQGAK